MKKPTQRGDAESTASASDEEPYLSEQAIQRIIETTGYLIPKNKLQDFADQLDMILELFLLGERERLRKRPSASKAAKRFEAIEKAATGLLSAFTDATIKHRVGTMAERQAKRTSGYADLPPRVFESEGRLHHYYRGREKLDQSVEGVRLLAEWAGEARREALAKVSENVKAGRKRHKGDWALQELVSDLVQLYARFFRRDAGTSVGAPGRANRGKSGGPLVRFIDATLHEFRETLTDEGVRKVLSLTTSAIREKVRPHLDAESKLHKSPPKIS